MWRYKCLTILFAFCLIIFSCQKELNDITTETLATGTLDDLSGNCLPDSVHGTFYASVKPGSDTAYVELQVNVTSAGFYSIKTNTVNGLFFLDSGFFNGTGLKTILLKPFGTPATPTTSIFSVSFDNSLCNFSVEIKDTTQTAPINSVPADTTSNGNPNANGVNRWQFTTDNGAFSGFFDTAKLVKDNESGYTYLKLSGRSNATKDSALHIKVVFPGTNIKLGTYETQGTSAASFEFLDRSKNKIYYTVNDPNSSSLVTINLILYNKETHIMEGLLSGRLNDSRGYASIVITGAFETTVTE